MSKKITQQHHRTFEKIKQTSEHGDEFWMARRLSKILGYAEFRNFHPVIEKAKKSCKNSGQAVSDHFVEMHEMVGIGSGAQREVDSYVPSLYASYHMGSIQASAQGAEKLKGIQR
jgi:DNA-damage-inducible protein D